MTQPVPNPLATASPTAPAIRPGFFEEAFSGYDVPPKIRVFAEAFCTRFKINGICDPAYCANTAALKLKVGDGCGGFDSDQVPVESEIPKIGDHLLFAYHTCINQTEPATTAEVINDMVRGALNGLSVQQLVPASPAPAQLPN